LREKVTSTHGHAVDLAAVRAAPPKPPDAEDRPTGIWANGAQPPTAASRRAETGQLRLSGLYPLLGQKPERTVGDPAQDVSEAVWTQSQTRESMVSGKPARTAAGASGEPGPETQRTLWVLRHYGQCPSPTAVSVACDQGVAEVASSPRRPARDALGADEPLAGVLLPARSTSRTLH